MKNIIFTLNSLGSDLSTLFAGESWEKRDIQDLSSIDYDLIRNNKGMLLVRCGDKERVKSLFANFELRSCNLPTAFLLDYEDQEIINLCYQNDFTHIFMRSDRHLVLKAHINYTFKNYELTVRNNGQKWLRHIDPKQFTKKEFQIIEFIAQAPMTELSREELQDCIWGNTRNTTNKLDVHICNLRKKLTRQDVVIQTNERGKVSLAFNGRLDFDEEVGP